MTKLSNITDKSHNLAIQSHISTKDSSHRTHFSIFKTKFN